MSEEESKGFPGFEVDTQYGKQSVQPIGAGENPYWIADEVAKNKIRAERKSSFFKLDPDPHVLEQCKQRNKGVQARIDLITAAEKAAGLDYFQTLTLRNTARLKALHFALVGTPEEQFVPEPEPFCFIQFEELTCDFMEALYIEMKILKKQKPEPEEPMGPKVKKRPPLKID